MKPVLDISSSVLEQAWHWRGGGTDGRDPDFQPDDLVTQLLMARGVDRDDIERHRNPTIRNFMPDPSIFQDMENAALRLAVAVEAGEQITVYGDYDVDGAASSALMFSFLRHFGVEAEIYIPDRIFEGYGPNAAAIDQLIERGATLLITVDCGSTSVEALGAAERRGVDVAIEIELDGDARRTERGLRARRPRRSLSGNGPSPGPPPARRTAHWPLPRTGRRFLVQRLCAAGMPNRSCQG